MTDYPTTEERIGDLAAEVKRLREENARLRAVLKAIYPPPGILLDRMKARFYCTKCNGVSIDCSPNVAHNPGCPIYDRETLLEENAPSE